MPDRPSPARRSKASPDSKGSRTSQAVGQDSKTARTSAATRSSQAAQGSKTARGSNQATSNEPGAAAVQRAGGARLAVRKTYKLFIGGAFPRSESGRSYPVTAPGGGLLAHAALASRKDARDAVAAARKALPGWSGATAYNRGQVLYRVAELLEGRADQFSAECVAAEDCGRSDAEQRVAAAIDRWVWYAGWPDKVAQVAGGANPVAGPYFNLSVPEPTGVVAILAPPGAGLLGLVSVLAPVIATGNTAVVVASGPVALSAVSLAEVLATSDVPAGVVNVLTGRPAELAPVLAAHMDVNAIDLTGVDPAARAELERLAAGNVKRVFAAGQDRAAEDWAAPPDLRRLLAFLETKTIWHPIGI
jgi:delta 1-pyrroline-5-carboxylate dehydrogenase